MLHSIVLFVLSYTILSIGSSHPTRDAPASNTHNVGEMQDGAFTDVPESVASVNRSRADLADNQSATDSSEDVLIPAVPSHPVLLEDPLILNSPRISIPQKNEAVFKRNKWSQATEFPSVSRNVFPLFNVII